MFYFADISRLIESSGIPDFALVSRRGVYDFFRHLLTYAADGEHSYGLIGRRAIRE